MRHGEGHGCTRFIAMQHGGGHGCTRLIAVGYVQGHGWARLKQNEDTVSTQSRQHLDTVLTWLDVIRIRFDTDW